LIERERNPQQSLEVFRTISPSVSPLRNYSAYENQHLENGLAKAIGATAVFCGGVGDQVFGTGVNETVAADFIACHGIRPALLRIALDVARRRKLSIWRVLRRSLFDLQSRRPRQGWHDYLYSDKSKSAANYKGLATEALMEEVGPTLSRFIHPWYQAADGVPEYKLWTISGLTAEMCYDGPFTSLDGPPLVTPIGSQPLVELCLRIESHLNVRDGWDRAVVRQAFSNNIPEIILRRTSKGGGDFWMAAAIQRNMPFIREYLLDGLLVGNGLLDLRKLKVGLSHSPTRTHFQSMDIIRHLYNEAWLRNWTSYGSDFSLNPSTRVA
jgi:asparagine synthase (glutamine-hydrolysing)